MTRGRAGTVLASAASAVLALGACGTTKTLTTTTAQRTPPTATATAATGTSTDTEIPTGPTGQTGATGSISGPPASTATARLQGLYAMAYGTESGNSLNTQHEDATKWPMRSTCTSTCAVSLNYPPLTNGSGAGFKSLSLHPSGPGRYTSDPTSGATNCLYGSGREQRTISVRVVKAETIGGVPTATRLESYESARADCPKDNPQHFQFRIHRFGDLAGTL